MSDNIENAPRCSIRGPCCGPTGKWIWIALIAMLVILQWPMIKGLYYRVSGAQVADGIGWKSDFDAALAESAKTNRPILLDFTASWCPPCQVMKHDVWPEKEVGDLMAQKYIPMLVDVDDSRHAALSQRYGVTAVPTILVVDKDGNLLARAGFMSKNAMLDFLKRHAKS